MTNKDFNIFARLQEELDDYFTGKIKIGQGSKQSKRSPYEFSQFDTLETIDYYCGSKFERGEKDTDGTPKIFLNLVSFRAETASKNIDLDVKDFTFIPESDDSIYGALLLRKLFRRWAKEKYFGEMINDMVDDFPKYGTIVVKRAGRDLQRVDLCTLRNQQDAESLNEARYVIEEHKDMLRSDMEAYKDWDLTDLKGEWDTKTTVYERYGYVPLDWYNLKKGYAVKEGDEKKSIKVISILAPDADTKDPEGALLFCEEVKELPYQEVHYKKLAGRWLGEGEVEKNFGNQVARNMIFNLRKRALAWSSKNIFQSVSDEVANNLVREVKDGDVLKIEANGALTRVDTVNRSNADAGAIDTAVEENANQRSFTFESATGEALPSGTSFRLGAMMTNTVQSYYKLKRQKLGLFFTRLCQDDLIPIFERDNKDAGKVGFFDGEDGFDTLRMAKKEYMKGQILVEKVLKGDFEGLDTLTEQVDLLLSLKTSDFYSFEENYWKNLKYQVAIEVTGESTDVVKKMETLTTLYTSMVQTGNPNAESVLKRILALTGEKMPLQTGIQSPMGQMPNPMAQGQTGATAVPSSMGNAEQMAGLKA